MHSRCAVARQRAGKRCQHCPFTLGGFQHCLATCVPGAAAEQDAAQPPGAAPAQPGVSGGLRMQGCAHRALCSNMQFAGQYAGQQCLCLARLGSVPACTECGMRRPVFHRAQAKAWKVVGKLGWLWFLSSNRLNHNLFADQGVEEDGGGGCGGPAPAVQPHRAQEGAAMAWGLWLAGHGMCCGAELWGSQPASPARRTRFPVLFWLRLEN